MDRNLMFQHIFTKIYWKNTFKISLQLQYLEHELRHLCPLNPIQTPESFFEGFKNELRHLCPLNRIQIFQKFSATP